MFIKKELELSWEGTDYKIGVNMDMINRIESSGLNLMTMVDDTNNGVTKFSEATRLIVFLLNEGGCEVTQDDAWAGLTSAEDEVGMAAADMVTLLWEIFPLLFVQSKKKLVQET